MTHCAAPPTTPEPAAAIMESHYAWYLHVATRPPAVLERLHHTVTAPLARGLAAIDVLLDRFRPVSPLRICPQHHRLHVPVPVGTADRWHAPHSMCSAGAGRCEDGVRPCVTGFWVLPDRGAAPLTHGDAYYDALSLVRYALQPTEVLDEHGPPSQPRSAAVGLARRPADGHARHYQCAVRSDQSTDGRGRTVA